jgi:signal transduction histidine kinase
VSSRKTQDRSNRHHAQPRLAKQLVSRKISLRDVNDGYAALKDGSLARVVTSDRKFSYKERAMETFTERGTIKTIATHYIEGAFRLRQNSAGRADCVVLASFPNTSSDESTTNSGAICDVIAAARLTERKRIAQELHDTLLQGCLGVSMQLHATVDDLSPDSSEKKKRLSDALQLLDRVLEQGRSAVEGLRSPTEHIASLGDAFAGVRTDLGLPSAIGFRVVVHGKERELRAGLSDEVYRIGREAIINAYRHSGAKDIETEVEFQPSELRIAVRDNGRGINPQELQWGRNGHWGLQGMRERAERIGAQLRLWSRVALGTEVELCVPGQVAFEQLQGRPCRHEFNKETSS